MTARKSSLPTSDGGNGIRPPSRRDTERLQSLVMAMSIGLVMSGCQSKRMTLAGAVSGVVTGPVSSLIHGLSGNWSALSFFPLSIPYGISAGWTYGRYKDKDFADFGTYEKPGTYRLVLVFDPFRHFPKCPAWGEDVYPGENPVFPLRDPEFYDPELSENLTPTNRRAERRRGNVHSCYALR